MMMMLRQKLTMSVLVLSALLLGAPAALHAQYAINLTAGGGPNNLPELSSSIGQPGGIALDGSGNTYVVDINSSRIFKIDSTGTLTVFAGNESRIGEGGYSGDGGPATSAELGRPVGVAVDAAGDVFIADTDNSVIRCVAAATGGCFNATLPAGYITTVAGIYYPSTQACNYSGDSGPATSAQLCRPAGVFVDGSGNIFIADTDNSVIREVVATTGNIKTVAGSGTGCTGETDSLGDGCAATSAQLNLPFGVFVDGSGDIFVADTYNSVIREVPSATGLIQTIAGTPYDFDSVPSCMYSGDEGLATAAYLCLPGGVFVDGSGNIFIADTENSVIREVAGGNIATVAGNGTAGYSGDGSAATSAQLNLPSGLFVDSSDDIYIADTYNFAIREVSSGTIQTIMGNNTIAYSGDGGTPTDASLYASGGVFLDGLGNLFIADTYNNVLREIAAGSNVIQTVAGNAALGAGYAGDGAAATSAQLNLPYGLFVDSSGDIFIADTENSVVRCVVGVTPAGCFNSGLAVGSITTVAGNGVSSYFGDGGPATSAELSNPYGVFVNSAGDLFIADTENSVIRCVVGTASTGCFNSGLAAGSITTVAGNDTVCQPAGSGCGDGATAIDAQLNFPKDVSGDSQGDLFIADTFDSKIREVVAATGVIQTVAGSTMQGYAGDGGLATSAQLNDPYGVYVDSLGNLFIADTDNAVVREVVAVTGFIQTIAGNGTEGYSGDGGSATSAQLANPLSVTGNSAGNLYVADTQNSRVRELTSTVSIILVPTSATLPVGDLQQFAASVSGASDSSVTWQVNGITGGNLTVGTVSILGSYQAPSAVPAPATVMVTAIANANGLNSAMAQVTVVSSSTPAITLSTNPAVTAVYTSTATQPSTQTFLANVVNSTDTTVWQVNGMVGGNATVGTISTAGLYTAPAAVPTPATVVISAALAATPSVSASYPITIVAAPMVSQPAAQTISSGGSADYALSLDAKTGIAGEVMTLSCLNSSLPPNATCTFTPSTITPGSSATPFTLTVNTNVCVAAADRPSGTLLASRHFVFFLPAAAIFLAGWDKRKRRWLKGRWLSPLMLVLVCVSLSLLVSCGSGGAKSASCTTPSGTYHVQVLGTTQAQPNPVAIVTVTLTVK